MTHAAALYVGYVVLGSAAIIGAVAVVLAAWWWFAGRLVDQVWTLKLFYETAGRILDDRRTPDRDQLTHWPPSPTGRWPWQRRSR